MGNYFYEYVKGTSTALDPDMEWRYVDHEFPLFANEDQTALSDFNEYPLIPASFTRVLNGPAKLNLGTFSLTKSPTLEFWVTLSDK